MKIIRSAIAAVCASLAMSAQASSYLFDVLYNGEANATLAAGSDDPRGQSVLVNDSFLWTITAQDGAEWRVINTQDHFPLMAFSVGDGATRQGDWTLTLRNDGSDVFTTSETQSVQEFAHMGTNTVMLTAGLVFDEMELNYTLTSFVPQDASRSRNVIQGLLPIFGTPELNVYAPGTVYAPVPEPSSLALTLAGALLMLGLARRRSEQARRVVSARL